MSLYGPRQLADSIRVVRANTIRVAEDIPESQYDYRATPESRSVAELLVHIAWLSGFDRLLHEKARITSVADFDFGAALDETAVEEKRSRTKAEIIDRLRTEGERWARWIEELPDAFLLESVRMPDGRAVNRFEMMLGTKEHEMQHRAQLTVLERLLGIVPHFTRNLQAARPTPKAAERELAMR
jgi:uncharacterized damage-inducible protein DinB